MEKIIKRQMKKRRSNHSICQWWLIRT